MYYNATRDRREEEPTTKNSAQTQHYFQAGNSPHSSAFGSLYDANGEKYCAVSALSRFFGYDIATASKRTHTDKNANPAELIPHTILEELDNFTTYGNSKRDLNCSCSKPDYYYHYSLIALLVHLNDYHKMTFAQIGSWLEGKDM